MMAVGGLSSCLQNVINMALQELPEESSEPLTE